MLSAAQRRRIQRQSMPSSQSDGYFPERPKSEAHTSRSDFAFHLRRWYAHFPPDSVLLIEYCDIEADPRNVLLRVAMHAGLDGG